VQVEGMKPQFAVVVVDVVADVVVAEVVVEVLELEVVLVVVD